MQPQPPFIYQTAACASLDIVYYYFPRIPLLGSVVINHVNNANLWACFCLPETTLHWSIFDVMSIVTATFTGVPPFVTNHPLYPAHHFRMCTFPRLAVQTPNIVYCLMHL